MMNFELLLGRFYRVRREVAEARKSGPAHVSLVDSVTEDVRTTQVNSTPALEQDSAEDTAPGALYHVPGHKYF